MTDVDGDLLEQWRFTSLNGDIHRKKPVRLRDREALGALLRAVESRAPYGFRVMLDEVDYEFHGVDELLDLAPPHVRVLHLQANGPQTLVVRLTSWEGGETWIWAQDENGHTDQEPLRRLVGIVEANSRRLGPRRHLGRLPWMRAKRMVPSVVARVRRDDVHATKLQIRVSAISAILGFAGGVIGGLVSR